MTKIQAINEELGQYDKLAQDAPVEPINQIKIINSLTGYLAWHNFPIIINSTGICKGLSTVYAKYVVENKRKEFMAVLHTISNEIPPNSEHDNFINHFAVGVLGAKRRNF